MEKLEKIIIWVLVVYHGVCMFLELYKELAIFNFVLLAGILVFDFLNGKK